jgi:uncharacterized membrane protein (UPF0127 family)
MKVSLAKPSFPPFFGSNLPRFFLPLLLVPALLAGCGKPAERPNAAVDPGDPARAQPRLQTTELWLGRERITAEMALTADQERTGMMYRTNIAENAGMIFVFPPQRASFWMKHCPLPLSIGYIDMDGVLQEIHDLEPHNTNSVLSAGDNIGYALETARGWFERHQVRVGMSVRTEHGSLAETFRGGK